MKIAFVSQYYYPEPFSNTQIVRELVTRGHSVEVLTGVPNYPNGNFYDGWSNGKRRRESHEGARIFRAISYPRKKGVISLILNYLAFVIFGSWAARMWKLETPDVVFSSQPSPVFGGIPAIVLARRFKVPLVFWVQDIWPESATLTLGIKSPFIIRILKWVSGAIYRRADLVLVQSHAFPKMLTRFDIPSSKIKVFPNTAPEVFKPIQLEDASKVADGIPKDGFKIMFAGNVGESQDFETIVEAAKLLQDDVQIHWLIIGSGRALPQLVKKVAELGVVDRFHFLGRHPEESMPLFFAHADAMLVSLKDSPIFALTVPYKVQCYMACGKPTIASLNGEGARIIERAKMGVSAAASQPEILAEKVRYIAKLPESELAEMSKNARAYFDSHYASHIIHGNLENWLRELVHSNGARID